MDQYRYMCLDRVGISKIYCFLHTSKSCQFTQLVHGGKDQRKLPTSGASQGFGRLYPYTLTCLQVIVHCLLVSRCGGEEEVGIEAFRHAFRRNPVRKVTQLFSSQQN